MAYIRKTHDEWEIQTFYEGEWCTECTEETFADAKAQKKCYMENVSVPVRIKKIRVPNTKVADFLPMLFNDTATRIFLKENNYFEGKELKDLTVNEVSNLVTYVAPRSSIKSIADNPFAVELWNRTGRKEKLCNIDMKERRKVWDKEMEETFGIRFY